MKFNRADVTRALITLGFQLTTNPESDGLSLTCGPCLLLATVQDNRCIVSTMYGQSTQVRTCTYTSSSAVIRNALLRHIEALQAKYAFPIRNATSERRPQ
jgi:hypothetical protein